MAEITRKELILALIGTGGTSRRANLQGVDLSGLNLSGLGLCAADLWGANLRGCKLRGCDLNEATLQNTDCTGADFTEANLESANLSNAIFTNAIFRGASFGGAEMYDAEFDGADFTGSMGQTDSRIGDAAFEGAIGWEPKPKCGMEFQLLDGVFRPRLPHRYKLPDGVKRFSLAQAIAFLRDNIEGELTTEWLAAFGSVKLPLDDQGTAGVMIASQNAS